MLLQSLKSHVVTFYVKIYHYIYKAAVPLQCFEKSVKIIHEHEVSKSPAWNRRNGLTNLKKQTPDLDKLEWNDFERDDIG